MRSVEAGHKSRGPWKKFVFQVWMQYETNSSFLKSTLVTCKGWDWRGRNGEGKHTLEESCYTVGERWWWRLRSGWQKCRLGRQTGETFWKRIWQIWGSNWLWDMKRWGVKDDLHVSDLSNRWCHLFKRKGLSRESLEGSGEGENGELCCEQLCLK